MRISDWSSDVCSSDLAVERDQYRLTGRDVVNEFVAERIERNRLRRDQIIRTVGGFALAIDDWTNAERIAEADDAVAGDHRHAGVGPAAAHMNPGHRGKDVVWCQTQNAALQQMGRAACRERVCRYV